MDVPTLDLLTNEVVFDVDVAHSRTGHRVGRDLHGWLVVLEENGGFQLCDVHVAGEVARIQGKGGDETSLGVFGLC